MSASRAWTGWLDPVPPAQWRIYESFLKEATRLGIPFAVAGTFATATRTGSCRDTSDMVMWLHLCLLASERRRFAGFRWFPTQHK